MAVCGFSVYTSGPCGSSMNNPASVECITISKCNKDIRGHLRALNISDATLKTEAQLILLRAGKLVSRRCTIGSGLPYSLVFTQPGLDLVNAALIYKCRI